MIICLIGATCTGKDTVKKELVSLGYSPVVSYTTRPMREGESDGVAYNFISDEKFEQLKSEGFFAETTSYQVYNDEIWKYGTAKSDLTGDKVIISNPEGVKNLRRNKEIDMKVFLLLASNGEIWNRLRKRGDNGDESFRRIAADEKDFEGINEYIDFAIRTDGKLSAKEVAKLIDYIYRRIK